MCTNQPQKRIVDVFVVVVVALNNTVPDSMKQWHREWISLTLVIMQCNNTMNVMQSTMPV